MKKLEQIKEERAIQDRSGGFSEDILFELKPRWWEGGIWYSGKEGAFQAKGAASVEVWDGNVLGCVGMAESRQLVWQGHSERGAVWGTMLERWARGGVVQVKSCWLGKNTGFHFPVGEWWWALVYPDGWVWHGLWTNRETGMRNVTSDESRNVHVREGLRWSLKTLLMDWMNEEKSLGWLLGFGFSNGMAAGAGYKTGADWKRARCGGEMKRSTMTMTIRWC